MPHATRSESRPDVGWHGEAPPPDAGFAASDFPGADAGLPGDRAARIAARRAFVDMKQLFLFAAENVEDRKGAWLRAQVRQAEDPLDLWLLRGPLLAALRSGDADGTRHLRAELYRRLDSTFPETFGLGDHAPSGLMSAGLGLPEPWEVTSASITVRMPLHP